MKIKIRNPKSEIRNNIIIIIFIIVITVIISVRVARAQSLSLSIHPPILEVMIKPDKSITQLYKLINTGESVIITPKLFELGYSGIKENADFIREKWISIISNDIDFDKPFLLGSGKEADFLLKISPSASVNEQDYYRALVFSTSPNLPSDTTVSLFSQNLATPVLISVTSTGVLNKAAQIIKFELPNILDSFDPLVANIDIKNTGKTYFRPAGNLTLTGPVGRGTYDLIPSALLSEETKQLLTELQPPVQGNSKTLYLPGFFIGKYQLELNFSLDESSTRVKEVKTFYALPWKVGLVIIILTFIFLNIRKPKKPSNNNQEANKVQ